MLCKKVGQVRLEENKARASILGLQYREAHLKGIKTNSPPIMLATLILAAVLLKPMPHAYSALDAIMCSKFLKILLSVLTKFLHKIIRWIAKLKNIIDGMQKDIIKIDEAREIN